MSGAFACIALIPVLPMVFPFVLSVIWFYSFFDALKRVSIMNNFIKYHGLQSDEGDFPSLTTVSPFSSLDEEVLYAKIFMNRRFPGEIWLGVCFIVVGALLITKIFYPPLWAWLISQNGASLLLAILLILLGFFTIVRSAIKQKSSHH